MERIASFAVDHNKLVPGLYLSRRDGDIVTLDLRFKKPNTGDLLTNSEMHSVEHLIATLLRNSYREAADSSRRRKQKTYRPPSPDRRWGPA